MCCMPTHKTTLKCKYKFVTRAYTALLLLRKEMTFLSLIGALGGLSTIFVAVLKNAKAVSGLRLEPAQDDMVLIP